MASHDSQIDKPQRVRPKTAELPDVNINTDAKKINTERLLWGIVARILFSYYDKTTTILILF